MMGLVVGTYYGLYLPITVDSYIKYNPEIKYYVYYIFSLVFFMNALVSL